MCGNSSINKYEKALVIRRLTEARKKILDLIEPLSEKKWEEVFLGKWCLKDLVAHLIGWDVWGLKATEEIINGKLPSYYQYYDRDWASFNDRLIKRYETGNKKSLLAAVRDSHSKLVGKLKEVPEKFYNKDYGLRWQGSKITVASDTLSQADDEEIHVNQIQKWLKSK